MQEEDVVTADLVIVGYGLAGATTTIVAHDARAKVVLLEKSGHLGGNSFFPEAASRTLRMRTRHFNTFAPSVAVGQAMKLFGLR